MDASGLHGNLKKWLQSYLTNRQQFVEIDGKRSGLHIIAYAVPEESLLGPRLFSIYVSDFPESITNGEFHLYTDDATSS